MKLKIAFVNAETGELVEFECTIKDFSNNLICFKNHDDEYAYFLGTTKIWKPKHNVVCAEEVELSRLNLEFIYNE